jgi:single-strand DNA-binding protein
VVIFNEGLCKVAEQYLKKGAKVYIEGALQTRKWTDQQGVEKYSTEVVLQGFNSVMTMLDGARGGGGGYVADEAGGGDYGASAPSGGGQRRVAAAGAGAGGGGRRDMDDEIPF